MATPSTRLSYPRGKVYDKGTDYVEFNFYKYKPPFNRTGEFFADKRKSIAGYNYTESDLERVEGFNTILMYMPEDINTNYGSNWGPQDFTNIGKDILNLAGSAANANFPGLTQGMADIGTNIPGRLPGLIGQGVADLINKLPGQIGGNVDLTQVLSGTSGIIINPNTELMFNGFKTRGFDISFKLTPEDQDEAGEIKKIIDTFKQASLPDYGGTSEIFEKLGLDPALALPADANKYDSKSSNNNYISNPYLCTVNFKKGSGQHPYLPKYKPCVIGSIDISYTPDGSWATYKDGSPVATAIKISFLESKLVYRSEISQGY